MSAGAVFSGSRLSVPSPRKNINQYVAEIGAINQASGLFLIFCGAYSPRSLLGYGVEGGTTNYRPGLEYPDSRKMDPVMIRYPLPSFEIHFPPNIQIMRGERITDESDTWVSLWVGSSNLFFNNSKNWKHESQILQLYSCLRLSTSPHSLKLVDVFSQGQSHWIN